MELAERKCYTPKAGGSTRTTGQMLVKTGIVSLAARTQPKPPPDVRVRAAAAFMNMWETFKWEGGFPTITAEQRAMQRRRLEGLGEEPTQEELGDMMWPQRAWWEDRDRIGECQSL